MKVLLIKNNLYIKIFIFIIFIFIVESFIIEPIKVKGISMSPSINDNDWILVNKIAYIFFKPKRGDIIVFEHPDHKRVYLIKRIIAIENDIVKIKNGIVYINNKSINEPYVYYKSYDNFHRRVVPIDNFFVLGDNRKISKDSRNIEFGFIDKDIIIGKVIK